MKKLFYVLAFIMCIAVFAACADSQTTDTAVEADTYYEEVQEPVQEPEQAPEEVYEAEEIEEIEYEDELEEMEVEEEETQQALATAPADLSDDIYSFSFSLNGEIFSLPFPFSEIEDAGWSGDDIADGRLDPGRHTLSNQLRNGEQIVFVSLVNTTENVLPFNETNIGRINKDDFDARRGAELVFPGNITIGSTIDEVIAAHGEPSETRSTDASTTLVYSRSLQSSVTFRVDNETNQVTSLRMENLVEREALPEFEGDMPDIVLSYEPPTALGDDWRSFTVRFDGDLYRLPAPVATFVENGWIIESDPNEIIPAQSSRVGISLRKGNQVMRTTVYNYDDIAQPITHTFVTIVQFSQSGAVLPIELPGGITENSTATDVLEAFGEPSRTSESTTWRTYSFGSLFEGLEVTLREDDTIQTLQVRNEPRRLN